MKSILSLSKSLAKWDKELEVKLINIQKECAKNLYEDVLRLAPSKKGEYASSIKVSETLVTKNTIKTSIYTDLLSENHPVGRMIEYGTGIYALQPHIGHTKTFIDSGYQYWYVPVKSVNRVIGKKIIINGNEFYIAYAQPAKPHFHPALLMNKNSYKEKIRKVVKQK